MQALTDFYSGRRVAVLGASGLIGSYCCKLLKESGAWVKAVLHDRPPTEPASQAHAMQECDLLDAYHARSAIDGCDVVVNCAGITGGIGLAHSDPTSYVGPATAMACNIIDACSQAKVRCGFLSSTTVYAPQNVPVSEHHLGSPLYPAYRGIGESKRFLEKLCKYYHETVGLEVAVVRPSGAYGRWDNFGATGHVLPMLIDRALVGGDTFELWGDGEDIRDIVHAEDVALGYLLAIAKSPNAEPFNIASGAGVTTGHLAQMVLDAVGSKATLRFRPDKPTALRTRLVNISKARLVLGYESSISLRDGIADVVAWRRAQ